MTSMESTGSLSQSIHDWLWTASAEGARSHRVELMREDDPAVARHHGFFHIQTKAMIADMRKLIDGPMVVVKGIEVAQLYPEPWRRDFVDLDVVVDDLLTADRRLRDAGFRPFSGSGSHPEYHQSAPLLLDDNPVTVELHRRPSSPRWNHFPVDELFAEALPSRTGVEGVLRPRDDHHAVVVAWHYWRDGAHRGRGLIDLHLLRQRTTDEMIADTAERWGVGRLWRQTQKVLDALENPDEAGVAARWLLDLSVVSHRSRRTRQWLAIATGGIGGVSEVAERLTRKRERAAH